MASQSVSQSKSQSVKRLSPEEWFGLGLLTLGFLCFGNLLLAQDLAMLTILMGWTAPFFGLTFLIGGLVTLFGARLSWIRLEAVLGGQMLLLALMAGTYVWMQTEVSWHAALDGRYGGLFGRALGNMLMSAIGRQWAGAVVQLVFWFSAALIVRYTPLMFFPLMATKWMLWGFQWMRQRAGMAPTPATQAPAVKQEAQPASRPEGARPIPEVASPPASGARSTDGSIPAASKTAPKPRETRRTQTRKEANPAPQPAVDRTPRAAPPKPAAPVPVAGTKAQSSPPSRVRANGLARRPSLDLLSRHESLGMEQNAQEMAERIARLYTEYEQPVEVVSIEIGPAVTRFGVKPGQIVQKDRTRPVRVRDVLSLQNDIAMGLEVESLRYLAPVPGRPYVGIEVPNAQRDIVDLHGVLSSWEYTAHSGSLKIGLGRDTSGNVIVLDLISAPHVLVSGATGTGKSTCINVILTSLLMQHGPESLNLVLVDPKRIELTPFEGIPHLVGAVATDVETVPSMLLWLLLQMDARYKLFKEMGVRNLLGFNQLARTKGHMDPLPYIVLVIDELADLMMVGDPDIESRLCRLAQKCRATGIHIVLATQRPSVDVLTGVIKANFPTRIAFAVTSGMDSRVILDEPGAEALLGKGDMIYKPQSVGKPLRVQGSWVGDEDMLNVVNHWKSQQRLLPKSERVEPWRGLLDIKAAA